MIIQVIIRLTLYIDQAIIRNGQELADSSIFGIQNTVNINQMAPDNNCRTNICVCNYNKFDFVHSLINFMFFRGFLQPFLCEGSYVLLEYARTAMFMWMFIEGLYLHNVVTVTVLQGRFPHMIYAIVGWGLPAIMTIVWAVITARFKRRVKYVVIWLKSVMKIRKENIWCEADIFSAIFRSSVFRLSWINTIKINSSPSHRCWWGYNFTSIYWILEGPRLAVLLLNFTFLLNIIRVLVVKLRQSHTSEIEQVRKAVRAAIVLIPLLGITNIINMTEAPLHRTPIEFALWSFTTHFLTSSQGLFIATIYCFLNNEVIWGDFLSSSSSLALIDLKVLLNWYRVCWAQNKWIFQSIPLYKLIFRGFCAEHIYF